ncbi:arylesterase [uncultured Tateyamaria sp.]|uniref:arylesterase n=1 Tax=uncultured Tateyamaria sp. TaxID=455651 RepID=UPI00260BA817|nr:arylesterase [uncultured Tateyamaria sp.]
MSKVVAAIVLALWGAVASAGQVTVAALGDSLTQGYGLPVEQGFVPQLEGWLTAQGQDVALINAGVSGDTTQGGLSRIDWTLTPDVDALIVTLGGNDLLRGIAPEVSRANLDAIVARATQAGVAVLVVGMQAPGNYGPDYKQAFDAMYPEIAADYGALYVESFFEGLGGAGTDPAALGAFMQADGIHPNADGVARIVEGLGPHVIALIERAE